MSWFQSTGLNSAYDSLTQTVQKVTESVQDVIPAEHKDLLAKLTLNTEEMISERQNFQDEATRKEHAKSRLDKLLPWETSDKERDILVKDCKESIFELSCRESTFFGPYEMPRLNVQLEVENTEEEHNEKQLEIDRTEEEDGNDSVDNVRTGNSVNAEGQTIEVQENSEFRHYDMEPSEESREKLAKLEPLPPLLEDFDLDAHVGLIQKLLKEDPELVKMQATLSGGGPREKVFWRNYFFHCAFTRYEAGLSIDEIWSYQEESKVVSQPETISNECSDTNTPMTAETDGNEEEAIIFDGNGNQDISFENVEEIPANDAPTDGGVAALANSELSPTNGFELVDDAVDDDTENLALDELEAEIARELED